MYAFTQVVALLGSAALAHGVYHPAYLLSYYFSAYGTPPPAPAGKELSGDVTYVVINMLSATPVVTYFGTYDVSNLPPVGPLSGTFISEISFVVPSGWAGEYTLNMQDSAAFNVDRSHIEGNWGVNDPYNDVYVDVSYATSVSIPIACGCQD